MQSKTQKMFIGPKIRRLREQQQLNQAAFADRLGLSHSYINQLENNQRPATAAVLIKLASCFGVDIAGFASELDQRLTADIYETLQDPQFNSGPAHWQDVQRFVEQQPDMAQVMSKLYQHHTRLQENYEQLVCRFYGEQNTAHLNPFPHEEVRDYFYQNNNYIDLLDRAAEQLRSDEGWQTRLLHRQLREYLFHHYQIEVVTVADTSERPPSEKVFKKFSADKHKIYLAKELSRAQQVFQLASQLAQLLHRDTIDKLCDQANFSSDQARQLAKIGLAHYFAGSLLMPYSDFLREAEKNRYDIEYLQHRFQVSTEQICHRLSTLQRQGDLGIPFYFVRVDQAGNISKRQSATSFHFARTGGACPLWNVHDAFSNPNKPLTQIAQMPDGKNYFCLAMQVNHSTGSFHASPKRFAIGLGCELEHAHRLVYSDGLDLSSGALITPIGPGCRVCPRSECAQRAFPPVGTALVVDENKQTQVPYNFIPNQER